MQRGREDGSMSGHNKRSAWVSISLIGSLAITQPAEPASFDCANARVEVEHMICDNPDISKLDEEVAASYKIALKKSAKSQTIRQTQRQWIKERNNCKDVSCVKHIFEVRFSELRALSMTVDEPELNAKQFKPVMDAQIGAADVVKPGTYKTEGDWGSLVISSDDSDKSLKFTIGAIGGNAHVCDVTGKIYNNQGRADDEDFIKAGYNCIIRFEKHPDRISVVVSPEKEKSCRMYCGASAWFEGDYFPFNSYCARETDVRTGYQQLLEAKKFLNARNVLSELLGKCERFMYWHAKAEVRNDFADTEFYLGDKAACLKALEPIKEYALNQDMHFAPADEEWGRGMLKKTRANWIRCGGKVTNP
jgi:uncharacterized protein YecT (DUF1311 family)